MNKKGIWMNKIILTFIITCFFFQISNTSVINVFGDSHGSFMFSNERTQIPRNERSVFSYTDGKKTHKIPFSINWFGSKTMHSIGRDGLMALNLKNFGVSEGDVAVFVFGEVDARCHVGKQHVLKGEI